MDGIEPAMRLSDLQNALRGGRSPGGLIAQFRATGSPTEFARAAEWLRGRPNYTAGLWAPLRPKWRSSWRSFSLPEPIGLLREVRWLSALLRSHTTELRSLVEAKTQLECVLLENGAQAALDTLTETERAHGISLLTTMHRIALTQQAAGLEAQKKLLASIRVERTTELIKYCAYYASVLAEPGTTLDRFRRDYSDHLRRVAMPASLDALGRLLFLQELPGSEATAAALLSIVGTLPLLDQAWILSYALAKQPTLLGKPSIGTTLQRPTAFRPALARLSLGLASDVAVKRLFASLESLIGTCIAAQIGRSDQNPHFAEWQSLAINILRTVDGVDHEIAALQKWAVTLPSLATPGMLAGIAASAWFASPATAVDSAVEASAAEILALSATDAGMSLDGRKRRLFAGLRRLVTSASSSENGATRDALSWTRLRDTRAQILEMVSSGQLLTAMKRIVATVRQRPGIASALPIAQVAQLLDENQRSTLRAEPACSLLLGLYAKHCGADKGELLAWAVDDLLEAHEVTLPSELVSREIWEAPEDAAFFAIDACKEPVLDTLTSIGSSRDVMLERQRLIEFAAERLPSRAEEILVALSALERDLRVQRRFVQLDRSRIYVDREGVVRATVEEVAQQLGRLRQFADFRDDAAENWLELLEKGRADMAAAVAALELPKDERAEIVTAIVSRVLEEYVLSEKHGLDAYLSVRVRHGVLAGRIREPMERARLVTRRDETDEAYEPNWYWARKLYWLADDGREGIASELSAFSAEFDVVVDDLVQSRLQVKAVGKELGLFDFALAPTTLALLARVLLAEATAEDVVRATIEFCDAVLDTQLTKVRDYIGDTFRTRMHACCERAIVTVEALDRYGTVTPLTNELRAARGELDHEIDRVRDWFVLSEPLPEEPFELPVAIDLASRPVRGVERNFHVDYDPVTCGRVVLTGSVLSACVDILYTLFVNAAEHSKLMRPVVSLTARQDGDLIVIEVTNRLGADADRTRLRARVHLATEEGGTENALRAMKREGGTGLYKVTKILLLDVGAKRPPELEMRGNDEFTVRVFLPARTHNA